MTIELRPAKFARILCAVVAVLIVCHILTQAVWLVWGYDHQLGVRHLFDLGQENNIPTWYASCALLLCGLQLLAIGFSKKQAGEGFARHWMGLAGIFCFLSLDEAASIHEFTIPLLRPIFKGTAFLGGYLNYPWVVAWALLVLAVGLSYLRFLGALPSGTRWKFVFAGVVYVGGALGTELIEGRIDYLYGIYSVMHAISTTVQESMEMIGVLLFQYALSKYMAAHAPTTTICIVADDDPSRVPYTLRAVQDPTRELVNR